MMGKRAWGDCLSARTFKAADSSIGVATDSNRRLSEFDLCSFETAGPWAMIADRAERPSSGAKVTRIIRPNRTEVLLFVILA